MSIDYFQIKVDDAITLVARDFILKHLRELARHGSAVRPRHARKRRYPRGPRARRARCSRIDTLPLNAASIETSGVDVALGYALEFGAAQRLNVSLAYTYLDKLTLQQNPDLAPEKREGAARRSGPPRRRLRASRQPRPHLLVGPFLGQTGV
jgi:hypothetical protein